MKLAIPDLISNSYFPAVAAVELGLFAKQGLDVSLELIFPVDKSYRALRDGEIEFVEAAPRTWHWRHFRNGRDASCSARRGKACTGSW